jgi:hypothetical protein
MLINNFNGFYRATVFFKFFVDLSLMCVVFCWAVNISVVLLLMPFVCFFYHRSRFVPVERSQYFPTNSAEFCPRIFFLIHQLVQAIFYFLHREEKDCERAYIGPCSV